MLSEICNESLELEQGYLFLLLIICIIIILLEEGATFFTKVLQIFLLYCDKVRPGMMRHKQSIFAHLGKVSCSII